MNAAAVSSKHDFYLDRVQFLNKRIEKGIENGKLTAEQADSFSSSLKGITESIDATTAANGGHLTVENRLDIHKQMNVLSRSIFQTKHPAPPPEQPI